MSILKIQYPTVHYTLYKAILAKVEQNLFSSDKITDRVTFEVLIYHRIVPFSFGMVKNNFYYILKCPFYSKQVVVGRSFSNYLSKFGP